MFDAAVPCARQALRQAGHLLDVVAASGADLLSARLAPGMIDCAGQFRTTAGFALRCTFPLTTKTAPTAEFDDDLAGLRGRIGFATKALASLAPADFDGAEYRMVRHRAGDADLMQSGRDYLHLFAIPNLWFHLGMAYAILRAQGLGIGKADFDGWHQYPASGATGL